MAQVAVGKYIISRYFQNIVHPNFGGRTVNFLLSHFKLVFPCGALTEGGKLPAKVFEKPSSSVKISCTCR